MPENPNRDEAYEQEHVHTVYEQIASHFSSTRYKPWPLVEQFLLALPDGAVGVDVGCGNGKYLAVNPNVFVVGSDRSTNLIRIASTRSPQQKPQQTPKAHAQTHAHAHDAQNYAAATTTTTTNTNTHAVIVADSLALPHPCRRFDFAISIAVIHHLSTRDRRVRTIAEILWLLRVGRLGANEESNDGSNDGSDDGSKGSGSGEVAGVALLYVWALEQKGSRRGWEEGQEQDVMVPWVMKGKRVAIEEGVEGVEGEENGKKKQKEKRGETVDETYHRYYHLYRKGELEEDIVSAGGRVVRSGYERDNWWAVARPGSDKEFM